ncbi:MAG: PAS domain-containing protein [Syntrophotaleaceae bacterium]
MRKFGCFGCGLMVLWGVLLVFGWRDGIAGVIPKGLAGAGWWLTLLLLCLALQGLSIVYLLPHVRRKKQVQQALKNSENRFEVAAAAISDALVAIDDQARVVLFNPAAERLFGHAREKILGQSLDCLLPERYRERHRQALVDYFGGAGGERAFGEPLELPALHADGREIAIELSLSLLAADESLTVLAAIRDISRRKADEEALRLSEERFREMADLLPQSVFETDMKGQVTFVNHVAQEIAGWSDDDLQRQPPLLDLVCPQDRPRAEANMQRVLAGEPVLNEVYTLRRGDGLPSTVIAAVAPIIRGGQIVGMRGSAVDVSERLSVERRPKKTA